MSEVLEGSFDGISLPYDSVKKAIEKYQEDYKLLDSDQKQIVNLSPSILAAVNANAGSGKTRVLITRLINLILEHHIDSQEIVSITYTNKAARELKNRYDEFWVEVGGGFNHLTNIATIHSFSLKIINHILGPERKVSILTDAKAMTVLKLLIKEGNFTMKPGDVQYALGRAAQHMYSHLFAYPLLYEDGTLKKVQGVDNEAAYLDVYALEGLNKYINDPDNAGIMTEREKESIRVAINAKEEFRDIVKAYVEYKYQQLAFDFNDLILMPIYYAYQHPERFDELCEQYRYFQIDEMQDVAPINFALIKRVAGEDPNIVLVGDVKQTLFMWRGAYPNFLDMAQAFFDKRVDNLSLTYNYRSEPRVVQYANKFAENFKLKNIDDSKPVAKKNASPIHIVNFDSQEKEHLFIVRKIKEYRNNGIPYKDMSILVYTNREIEQLQACLKIKRIPYVVKRNVSQFTNTNEFKLISSLLILCYNRKDVTSLVSILSMISGFGVKSVSDVVSYMKFTPTSEDSVFSKMARMPEEGRNRGTIADSKVFVSKLDEMLSGVCFDTVGTAFKSVARIVMELYEDETFEIVQLRQKTLETVFYIYENAHRIMREDAEYRGMGVIEQIEYLNMNFLLDPTEDEETGSKDGVVLSTVHSFKGRESSVVFAPNLHPISPMKSNKLEEMRCVFYVIATRAKDHLHLSWSDLAPNWDNKLVTTYGNPFLEEYIGNIKKDRIEEDKRKQFDIPTSPNKNAINVGKYVEFLCERIEEFHEALENVKEGPNGCQLYKGYLGKGGYPAISVHYKGKPTVFQMKMLIWVFQNISNTALLKDVAIHPIKYRCPKHSLCINPTHLEVIDIDSK